MCFHDNYFNQDINNPTHDDNYFTISSLYTLNPNEPKLEVSNILNDYFNISKFPLLDEDIKKVEPNERQNLPNTKETKTTNSNTKIKIKNAIKPSRNSKNNDNITASTYPVEIEKSKKSLKGKCQIGLKRKRDNYNIHDKYADDNLRRKAKNLVLNYTLKFINKKIKDIYKGNIGNGIIKKEIVPLNHSIKNDATIGYCKNLIYKTLKDIFSANISSRFKAYSFPNKNDIIINRLLNDKDENKRLFFQRLFNITFIQCIEAFSATKNYEELKGFVKFDDIRSEFDEEPEYIDKLEYYLKNFEILIKERKGRNKRNKKEENNSNDYK